MLEVTTLCTMYLEVGVYILHLWLGIVPQQSVHAHNWRRRRERSEGGLYSGLGVGTCPKKALNYAFRDFLKKVLIHLVVNRRC